MDMEALSLLSGRDDVVVLLQVAGEDRRRLSSRASAISKTTESVLMSKSNKFCF